MVKDIVHMGHFTAIGMRTKVNDVTSLVINTCSDNDSREIGDIHRWSWSNPTNRKFLAGYADLNAVSVESLWQRIKAKSHMVLMLVLADH